ncbi:MAG: glycosyltransferase family 4 protein [Pseudomonadota bacterium]
MGVERSVRSACASPAPSRPLSVLVVNSLYRPQMVGGAEVVAEMLATKLAAGGHRVSVVTSCSRERDHSVDEMDGVTVYRFFPKNLWWLHERFAPGDRRSAFDKLRWRITDAWNQDAARKFAEILDRVRPDVVHTHNIKGFSPAVWRLAKRRGIPVVHTGHSYELICAGGALLGRNGAACAPRSRCLGCHVHGAWYRAQAEAIDVFCSPSDFLLKAHAAAGVVPKRTAHVPNGIARALRPRQGRRGDRKAPVRYLYLGQLAGHKGIDTLIGAIRSTRAAFTVDIAGQGDGETSVRALAGSDSRVRFHGFVDGAEKDRLLSNADALLFPSIWVENAPMSIAEAFRYGLPVIGSRIGAIPEFVEHGTNGMLFDVGNAASLAWCMTLLCERPERLQRITEGAVLAGAAWPTPDDMVEAYLAIYRSLVAGTSCAI